MESQGYGRVVALVESWEGWSVEIARIPPNGFREDEEAAYYERLGYIARYNADPIRAHVNSTQREEIADALIRAGEKFGICEFVAIPLGGFLCADGTVDAPSIEDARAIGAMWRGIAAARVAALVAEAREHYAQLRTVGGSEEEEARAIALDSARMAVDEMILESQGFLTMTAALADVINGARLAETVEEAIKDMERELVAVMIISRVIAASASLGFGRGEEARSFRAAVELLEECCKGLSEPVAAHVRRFSSRIFEEYRAAFEEGAACSFWASGVNSNGDIYESIRRNKIPPVLTPAFRQFGDEIGNVARRSVDYLRVARAIIESHDPAAARYQIGDDSGLLLRLAPRSGWER